MSFTNQLERFTPSSRASDIVGVGLGRLKRYWPERYEVLIGMVWYWCPFPEVCGGFAAINNTEVLVNPHGLKRIENSDDPEGHSGFLWGHEGGHKFGQDSIRFIDLHNRDAANQAMDYHHNIVIHRRNEFLRPKIGFTPFPLIEFEDEHGKVNICHDVELAEGVTKGHPLNGYETMTIRRIYQILAKEDMKDDQQQDDSGDSGDQQDDGDSGDQQDGGGQGQPQDDSGDSGDQKQDGSSGSQQGKDLAEETGSYQTGRSISTLGGNVLAPTIPDGSSVKEEIVKEERKINSVILSNQIAEKKGETYLSAEDLRAARNAQIGELTGNPIPWDAWLDDLLDNMREPKWRTPYNHDAYVSTGVLMDSRDKPSLGTVAFAFDMSGSISEPEVRNQLARANEFCINQEFERIYLIPIDNAVGRMVELNYGDPFPDSLESLGCGGTNLDKVFTYLEREQLDQEISALFFFTDGETNWGDMPQEEPEDYKVFWLDYGDDPDQYIWGERVTVDVA